MTPKIPAPVRLTDRVESILVDEILSGRKGPGDRLPTEAALVEELGVSRTVVREALSRMRSAGLIEPRQGVGVFVAAARVPPLDLNLARTSEDQRRKLLDVIEVRKALEGDAALLAAERATTADKADIRRALHAIDIAVDEGGDGVNQDIEFHRTVAESSHNPIMVATIRYLGHVLRDAIRIVRTNEARRADFIEAVRTEHRAIADAVLDSNPDAARDAARAHMIASAARLAEADDAFWTQLPKL